MAVFNFGQKQRLHTQMYGRTTGKEMFQVDEYNQRKSSTAALGVISFLLLTSLYFSIGVIALKWVLFLTLLLSGVITAIVFNFKQQIRLRENLYRR